MKTLNKFITAAITCSIAASFAIAKDTTSEKERLEALKKLQNAINKVETYYVDDIKFNDIIDKAITGLMQNLDAHSSFLNEKALKDMQVQTSGEFGGLGITVGIKDGALTVIAPIDNTPAYKAGIKAGDIILKINDEATLGITIDEAVNKMRGKPKTPITLTIVRKGEPKPFDIKLTRDIIKVESVSSKLIKNDNILYIRVSNFDKNVTQKARDAIKKYPNVDGIILDLRNNPGGLLNQAVDLVDLFVDDGVIVSQKGRNEGENLTYKASPRNTLTKAPLVILVNGGSASASEIVSGALQDTKRAIIVGEKTFGKGSVQSIMPINKLEALKITIAKYYLPSGRSIQAVGVEPDVVVSAAKVPQNDSDNFSIKESELKAHLQNELEKIEPKEKKEEIKQETDKDQISQKQVNDDLQLKTAIDTIKVLKIKSK
ncbi:S41 family peptidase [Campylobacter sp. 19-13652]|uniref:S41 family peptidase n=1 Tax=Campylobacter sp. 19-13652 TaxID=2840180 RepID=UPI001C78C289|nr:protease [Campylobacter sp. 19-13652]